MDHTGEYSDWYNLHSAGQAVNLRLIHPEKWTPHLENGYEEGGICHDIESNGTESKMMIMNVAVTDDLDVKGGVYAYPGPLQTRLKQCLDLIRDIVLEEKKRQTSQSQALSHSSSDAALQDMLACGGVGGDGGGSAVNLKLRMDAIRPVDGANIGVSNSSRSLASLASLTSPGGVNSGTKRRANGDGDGYHPKETDETESLISVSTTEPAGPRTGCSEEAGDEESDFEAQTDRNLQSISLNDHGRLREFYATCFYRIQQTACRQIAQVFVKVVHPKKQTTYPYNGNRRTADKSVEKKGGKGSRGATSVAGSEAPHWWPAGVPHKEPAHMKTPDRMKLLLHILCDMKEVEDNPDKIKGVLVADLRAATDQDQTIQKMSRRVRHWLGVIYEIRGVEEDYLDGVCRERVSVHWPDNRRTRKQNEPRRRKTDDRIDRDEVALFDCDPDDASCDTPTEEQAIYTRDGNLYEESDSDGEAENEKSLCLFMAGEGSQRDNMSTTPTQASSMKNSRHSATQPFANMLPAMANGTRGLHGHPQMQSFANKRAHFRSAGDMNPAAMVQDSSSMDFEPTQQDPYSAIGMSRAAVGHLAAQNQLGSGNLAIRSIHHHQDHAQLAREADGMTWSGSAAAALAGAPYSVAYAQNTGTSGGSNQWQTMPPHDTNQLALELHMDHVGVAPGYAPHGQVSAGRDSRTGRRSSGSLLQEVSNRVPINAADHHLMPYDSMTFGGANGRPIPFEYSQ